LHKLSGDIEMKHYVKWALVSFVIMTVAGAGMVLADRDDYENEDEERGFFSRWLGSKPQTTDSADSQFYKEECGSCHFPFQPGFLPSDSWRAIMSGLEEHFGENAELSDEAAERISAYLLANAADRSDDEFSNKLMWSLRGKPNISRITETAFFRHEHEEIPAWVLQRQAQELSFANCDSCHRRALQGSYRESEIRIPGIGRWDD
jgi:mono/diheme cytochrome c family protein